MITIKTGFHISSYASFSQFLGAVHSFEFLHIQIKCEQRMAVLEIASVSFLPLFSLIPSFRQTADVLLATNPRAPTSIVKTNTFHSPPSRIFSANRSYLVAFTSLHFSMLSSAGYVNSIITSTFVEFEYRTISGLSAVDIM